MTREQIATVIVKSFYTVYNELGHGFLEKNYENALALELRALGLSVQQQQPIKVFYKGAQIGEYFADLLVENWVVVK